MQGKFAEPLIHNAWRKLMSKLKRLKRKRALQKKTNIRETALRKQMKTTLGTSKMADRMVHHHQDVLQNIEFALIAGYRNNHNIDDCIVADTLEAAIHSEMPENKLSTALKQQLDGIRQMRDDVPDDLWCDGIRTILQSVHRHSSLQPGSRNYLHFTSQFII
jgi:hypothetical protein